MSTSLQKFVFDPLSPQFAEDPYPVYRHLREQEGHVYSDDLGVYLLARFDDVSEAALHPKMVRSLEAFRSPEEVAAAKRAANWHDMPNHERFVQFSLLDSDGKVHDRLRKLVFREFTGGFVERHRGMIETYVNTLLDRLLQKKEIDFIADLAAHVPGHIIGNVLGVPDEDCGQLRVWSENIVQFFDVDRTEDHKQLAESATTEFYQYLKDLISVRTKSPKKDLVSTLIAAQAAGELDERELISTCMLILMAGHGSTIDVMGSGMLSLLKYPDQMVRLRNDPDLTPLAVQEMFRYESPLPYFHRYASEDVTLFGRRFEKGTKFGLLYGAANRDPDHFTNPDMFDVGRTPNRHMAFGRGPHLCLGNHLSRLDMEIIFTQLLRRTKAITLVGDQPEYKIGLSARGLVSLPVVLSPA